MRSSTCQKELSHAPWQQAVGLPLGAQLHRSAGKYHSLCHQSYLQSNKITFKTSLKDIGELLKEVCWDWKSSQLWTKRNPENFRIETGLNPTISVAHNLTSFQSVDVSDSRWIGFVKCGFVDTSPFCWLNCWKGLITAWVTIWKPPCCIASGVRLVLWSSITPPTSTIVVYGLSFS